MPRCVCGTTLTDLRTNEERQRWASRLDDCWRYHSNGTAYWMFCLRCHLRRWPNDRRFNNRWSSPAAPWYHRQVNGVRRLIAGDFYITQPPPELDHDTVRSHDRDDDRRVRPRLPDLVLGPMGSFGAHIQWRHPVATIVEIPYERWQRCEFASERQPCLSG